MTAQDFNRLHGLRMENTAAGYAMADLRPRFERITQRHTNGTAPLAVSAYQLFQTPPAVAAQLVSLLNLKSGAVVLEPSAGLGRILDALQPLLPSSVTAIEISSKCTGELFKQDRAGVKILQRDFLDVSPEETGLFDAVVMNPPFHVRSDIKHIQHALKFLRPGGRLASVCMDTHHRDEVLRPISKEWIKLPRGSFHESGTDIATVLLMIETQ